MFLHISHDQDQILAMRYIATQTITSKIKSLEEVGDDKSFAEISKLEKLLPRASKIRNDAFMVFDYLKYAIGENNYFDSIFIDGKKYVWISRSKFMKDLPILDIKNENNVSTMISQFVDMGILEKHTEKGQKSRVFLTFSDLANRVLGKTMDDREFVKDILIKAGFINKNNYDKKTIEENPQPPKQPKQKTSKYSKIEQAFRDMLDEVRPNIKWKSKTNFTKKALEEFKESGLSVEDVAKNYIAHQKLKGNFSKTIANFIVDYEACVEEFNMIDNNQAYQQPQNLKPLAVEYTNGVIEDYKTGQSLNWIVEKNGLANLEKRYHVVGAGKYLQEELKRRGIVA